MDGFIECTDGIKLYYNRSIPQGAIANVIINHGFAEHSGRYQYVVERLNEQGIGVYRYDLRGHGKSICEKGYIKDFFDFIEDADKVVGLAKDEYPELPLFMLGHSMGGFITCIYGIHHPNKLEGQLFSGAAVKKLPSTKGLRGISLKLLNKFMPRLKIKNPVSNDICSVQEVVNNYEKDPLVLKEAALNLYVEFLVKGMKWIEKNIEKYEYPCLITHGGDDKIVPKKIGMYLYNNISSKDKEIKIYDGLQHEILNEKDRYKVVDDMTIWLKNRIDYESTIKKPTLL